MAVIICTPTGGEIAGVETPLLNDVVSGVVNYKGRPIKRSKSGGWRSAYFIIGVEVAERFAYYGIGSNLITYLTDELGQSTATAAENVNIWYGMAQLLPLLGAFVADSYLGRYRTIVIASLLYILGLGLLTLSATLPSFNSPNCKKSTNSTSCYPHQLHIIFFFASLYLVAIAQGGHKPCVQAFGADQFDTEDPEECKAKSSFFNWWYFGICAGSSVTYFLVFYIQENLGWGLGFGIPCIAMGFALIVFLFGTMTYRFSNNGDEKSPFMRIGQVYVNAARNFRTKHSAISVEEEAHGIMHGTGFQQFKFLNKALVSPDGSKQGNACSMSDVEEAKAVLRLIPIWTTCLPYAIIFSQASTLFTKQGATLNRSITPTFKIPAASLQTVISFSAVIFIIIYDRILVPIARSITRKPSGITMLQRIGTGLCLSILTMVVSALVEIKRLNTALKYGLVDKPDGTIPMSVWWLVPQYMLLGITDIFAMVGLQEFFYDQVPGELRSIGLALYLSIFGIGSFLSGFLISIIEKTTGGDGEDGWFSNNLNRGHLDYFYLLLAGLSVVGLIGYLYFAKRYVYNRGKVI